MFLNIFNFFSKFSKYFLNILKIYCEFIENFLIYFAIFFKIKKIFSIAPSLPPPPRPKVWLRPCCELMYFENFLYTAPGQPVRGARFYEEGRASLAPHWLRPCLELHVTVDAPRVRSTTFRPRDM